MTTPARAHIGPPQPPSVPALSGTGKHTSLELPFQVPPALLDALAAGVAGELAARLCPPEPYLDVDAAAAYLGRPKSRVYELVAAGRLAHFREGRTLLFRHDDLDAVLRRVGAGS